MRMFSSLSVTWGSSEQFERLLQASSCDFSYFQRSQRYRNPSDNESNSIIWSRNEAHDYQDDNAS